MGIINVIHIDFALPLRPPEKTAETVDAKEEKQQPQPPQEPQMESAFEAKPDPLPEDPIEIPEVSIDNPAELPGEDNASPVQPEEESPEKSQANDGERIKIEQPFDITKLPLPKVPIPPHIIAQVMAQAQGLDPGATTKKNQKNQPKKLTKKTPAKKSKANKPSKQKPKMAEEKTVKEKRKNPDQGPGLEPHKKTSGGYQSPPESENQKPKDREQILAEGIKLHDQGVAGDKEAVKKALDLLQKLYQEDPKNPLIAGYYGSTTCLLGRDLIDPMMRFSKALEGLKILDRIIAEHPDHLQLRILRGNVCYRLPEMYFHRTTSAIEDFNHLVSHYEQNNDVFSSGLYWQILYDLGKAYKNLGRIQEAQQTWTKLISLSNDAKYKELVRQEGFMPQEASPPSSVPSSPYYQPPAPSVKKKTLAKE